MPRSSSLSLAMAYGTASLSVAMAWHVPPPTVPHHHRLDVDATDDEAQPPLEKLSPTTEPSSNAMSGVTAILRRLGTATAEGAGSVVLCSLLAG